ncbi:MAG TPA: phosphate ABC transporter permease subunit PstC [Actinomycetota bacterium]|nr:phosphate ABC transporter permease subunit PstC [Actinomycetota bacterium]
MAVKQIELGGLRGNPGRRRTERVVKSLFLAAAATSVVISALIVLSLAGKAFAFISSVEVARLFSPAGWFPRRGSYDIPTIVAGTFVIAGIAMLVATPLGLGAAVYLSEYAKPRLRRALKPILEILAGIPSVVLGFFAITFISPEVVQRFAESATFFNMAAAGIAVGILVTPIVASVSEDALRAVPAALREASYGMGARKRTTTIRVVFPAAVSGIIAALIVGLSRAVGETMIVAIAAGSTGGSSFTLNPLEPGQTMTAAMTALAIGSDQVKGAELTFESLYFVGMLLFLMTLLLNVAGERFVRRVRERY